MHWAAARGFLFLCFSTAPSTTLRFGLAGLRRASTLSFEDPGGALKRRLNLGQRHEVGERFRPPDTELALDLLREGTTPIEGGFDPSFFERRERSRRHALLVSAATGRQLIVLAHILCGPMSVCGVVGCTAQFGHLPRLDR
jgi:hypothetical protein